MGEVITGHVLSKREANRQNALRCTGPKSSEGKRRSARNSRKHGLLSKDVVIAELGETPKEFKALHQNLLAHYEPVGAVEEMLVERIAVSMWRIARTQRLETADVRRYLNDRLMWIERVGGDNTFEEGIRHMLGENDRRDTSAGIELMQGMLVLVIVAVREKGYVPEESNAELREYFGDAENGFANSCIATSKLARGAATEDARAAYKQTLLEMIRREHAYLERLRNERLQEERVRQQEEHEEARSPLIPESVLGKYLRFETTYERQLFKAIDQLERMQRQRKGDFVPAPVNVQLSTDTRGF